MKHDVRIGDSVLVRCKVVPTTQGSTSNCYPGVDIGNKLTTLDKLEIVSVEQAFRVGDGVSFDSGSHSGKITAIYNDYAWIHHSSGGSPSTISLNNLKRLQTK